MASASDKSDPVSREAWEERYRSGKTEWDIGQPAPPLARWFRTHNPDGKSALVTGCGRGHEARLLASLGARPVTAVDLSQRALQEACTLDPSASRKVTWVEGDVRAFPLFLQDPFDLVVEHTCFCALAPADRAAYVSEVHRMLKPGGQLVGLFYVDFENLNGPPFGISQAALRSFLEPAFTIEHWESHPSDSVPQRAGKEALVVARRPREPI